MAELEQPHLTHQVAPGLAPLPLLRRVEPGICHASLSAQNPRDSGYGTTGGHWAEAIDSWLVDSSAFTIADSSRCRPLQSMRGGGATSSRGAAYPGRRAPLSPAAALQLVLQALLVWRPALRPLGAGVTGRAHSVRARSLTLTRFRARTSSACFSAAAANSPACRSAASCSAPRVAARSRQSRMAAATLWASPPPQAAAKGL